MTVLDALTPTALYAQQVRDACSDLPPGTRDELLEDLDEHLADASADLAEGETLADRLGSPAAYAADLRQSAGYPPVADGRPPRPGFGQGRFATWVRSTWDDSETHPQGRVVRQYLTDLQPAWWLTRAYLVVTGLAELTSSDGLNVIPHVFGSSAIGLVLVVVAAWASIRLGRATQPDQRPDRRRRRLAGWFSAVAVLCLLLAMAQYDDVRTVYEPTYDESGAPYAPGFLTSAEGDPIKNIYAFAADGKPLDGVLLYDDRGRPIDAVTVWDDEGNEMVPRFPTTKDGTVVRNQYPTLYDITAPDGSDIAPPARPNLAVPVLSAATTEPEATTTTKAAPATPTTTAPPTTTTKPGG